MSKSMDPVKLSSEAVSLNLSLMRWRWVPEMELGLMSGLRVLLLGSGTLGCSVARNLLAWNVNTITMVDAGNVSYSNPARQSLFTHQDCLGGGKAKAEAAAEALRLIVPSVNATGVSLSIPMPGHPVDPKREDEVRGSFEKLEKLVKSHDVIFLLLDTREARWLPSLLAVAHEKVCLTLALGFDSYLVIRHGLGLGSETSSASLTPFAPIDGRGLACYFCADVTAPGNSSADRTLDEQCTVSRPGLSGACAGAGVEVLAAAVQHSGWPSVPAACPCDDPPSSLASCLGLVPHQIRAYLSRWAQLTPAVRRFQHCVACSRAVQSAFSSEGWGFVRSVLNSPSHLETVAGLTALNAAADKIDVDWSSEDD